MLPPPDPAPLPPSSPRRQINLLDPPRDGRHRDRTFFIQNFVEKFREMMRRQGVGRRDPLAPILDMLCEMLVHYDGLADELKVALARHEDRIRYECRDITKAADAVIAEAVRQADRSIAHAAERIEAAAAETRGQRQNVLRGFRTETEELLRSTVIQHERVRVWRDRMIVAALVLGFSAGAFWCGSASERNRMLLAFAATQARLTAALQRESSTDGEHWLRLIEWNRLSDVHSQCAPQPNGRLACTFAFWDALPPAMGVEPQTAPPRPPASNADLEKLLSPPPPATTSPASPPPPARRPGPPGPVHFGE
jgi:hypothetical protein